MSALRAAARAILLCLSGFLFVWIGACTPAARDSTGLADLVLTGGHILTDAPTPATALAVKGRRIVAVGPEADMKAWIGPATRVVALDGATVSPGFNDSHAHLAGLGKGLAQVDLVGTGSVDAALELARQAAAGLPPEVWLEGRGWDQNDWPVQVYPTAAQLDAVTGHRPAVLRRVDGHASWVNTAALQAAHLTAATPDPEGGEIVRLTDGSPSGILIDNASDLVRNIMPAVAPAEQERRVRLAIAHCWTRGVTGVHDAGESWEDAQLCERLAATGELGLRLYGMYEDVAATLEKGLARGPFFSPDSLYTVRAVKLYGDGALGSRGALLLQDYDDRPGHRGLPVTSADHMREVIRRAAAGGFQICTHAIGDAANRLALDIYEEVLAETGAQDVRWRIEHAQILDRVDIPRFGRLGVIAAMQPTHCTSDMDWAGTRLGDDRLAGTYAWRSLLDTGAHLCFGTDFPVERVSALHGLYAARTRTHQDGAPPGGWQPQEALTGREAHALYTAGSAYAAFQEGELGRIAPGFLADLVVLDGDPVTCEPAELLSMQVLHTIVNGELVYSK
jgi:hypothetical protein